MIDIAPQLSRPRKERTSALLRRILTGLPEEKVSIGFIVAYLRRRSFGGVFILLATLSLLPGISFFAGLVMIIPALQLVAGLRTPLLPKFISEREVSAVLLKEYGGNAIPWIEKIERLIKPRWLFLTLPPMTNITGLLVVALALVIMVPLPFSNLPPAVSILLLAFGLLEHDGLIIFFGIIASAIALTIGVLISYVAVEGMLLFFAQ